LRTRRGSMARWLDERGSVKMFGEVDAAMAVRLDEGRTTRRRAVARPRRRAVRAPGCRGSGLGEEQQLDATPLAPALAWREELRAAVLVDEEAARDEAWASRVEGGVVAWACSRTARTRRWRGDGGG
jgi:hypothetical protein